MNRRSLTIIVTLFTNTVIFNAFSTTDNLLEISSTLLMSFPREPITKQSDSYTYYTKNFRVHPSCIKKWGRNETTSVINRTFQKGLSCLIDIATENENANSKILLDRIQLHQNGDVNPTTLLCNDEKLNWKNIIGRGNVGPITKELHPFVSMNPDIETSFLFGFNKKLNSNDVSAIIFHEMIHNYGYTHGPGIDLAYACETCCFRKKSKDYNISCKICSNNYDSYKDKKYILDIGKLGFYSKSTNNAAARELLYGTTRHLTKSDELKIALVTITLNSSIILAKALMEQLNIWDISILNDHAIEKKFDQAKKIDLTKQNNITKTSILLASAIVDLVINDEPKKASQQLFQIDLAEFIAKAYTIGGPGQISYREYKELNNELFSFTAITSKSYYALNNFYRKLKSYRY